MSREVKCEKFAFTFPPDWMLKLINEKRFSEIRDYWLNELEKLEEERQLALKTCNWGLCDDITDRQDHALRMFDRYYVLADLHEKGKLDIRRGW